ncbi:MAG: hypothetical protein ACP5RC_12265, partial [Halothiobacillaceae bacterium]
LEAGPQGGRILFEPNPPIDSLRIVQLMQREPKIYQLGGQDALRFTAPLEDADERFGFIERLFSELEQGLER